MTSLVAEQARPGSREEGAVAPTEFRLDEVVKGAVDHAARRAPQHASARARPSMVLGCPSSWSAVTNLLDNAPVEPLTRPSMWLCTMARVEVRDHGPGIAAADAPLVFNRFYRAKAARGMPGAGLGLSIVKQIADAHGGSVSIDQAADGGAILRLQLLSTR